MGLFRVAFLLAAFSWLVMTARTAQNQVLELVLPTDNDALFSGNGPAFYQSVDRDYNGVKSTPWEGGQYGFVRDPKSTGGGVVTPAFTKELIFGPFTAMQMESRSTKCAPLPTARSCT